MPSNPVKIVIPPTTPGTTAPVSIDWRKPHFSATVQVYSAGAFSCGLEYTLDDVASTPTGSIRWLSHPSLPTGTTASGSALLTTPVCAVRLNVASNAAALEFRVLG